MRCYFLVVDAPLLLFPQALLLEDACLPFSKDMHLSPQSGHCPVPGDGKGGSRDDAESRGADAAQAEHRPQLDPPVGFSVRVAEHGRKTETVKKLGAVVVLG